GPASLALPAGVPAARLGGMPRESVDAPDDLPEEVLRQASDRLKRQTALTTMAVGRRVWTSPGPMLTGGGHAPGSGQRTAFRCRPRPCRWPAGTFACSWSTSSVSPVSDVEPC